MTQEQREQKEQQLNELTAALPVIQKREDAIKKQIRVLIQQLNGRL